MAQAARSYQPAYQQPQRRSRELEQPQRPPLYVIPGRGITPSARPQIAPLWKLVFIAAIAALLLLGIVCVARVALADSTMELTANSDQLSQSISDARSKGTDLEMQYSTATSTPTIQAAATQLGMAPDPQVEYLSIPSGE